MRWIASWVGSKVAEWVVPLGEWLVVNARRLRWKGSSKRGSVRVEWVGMLAASASSSEEKMEAVFARASAASLPSETRSRSPVWERTWTNVVGAWRGLRVRSAEQMAWR